MKGDSPRALTLCLVVSEHASVCAKLRGECTQPTEFVILELPFIQALIYFERPLPMKPAISPHALVYHLVIAFDHTKALLHGTDSYCYHTNQGYLVCVTPCRIDAKVVVSPSCLSIYYLALIHGSLLCAFVFLQNPLCMTMVSEGSTILIVLLYHLHKQLVLLYQPHQLPLVLALKHVCYN